MFTLVSILLGSIPLPSSNRRWACESDWASHISQALATVTGLESGMGLKPDPIGILPWEPFELQEEIREDPLPSGHKAARIWCQSARAPSQGGTWGNEAARQRCRDEISRVTETQRALGLSPNIRPTSWLCVVIIDPCLFLLLLCFRFLSVVTLRVLRSPVSVAWKWSDAKKSQADPGITSRNPLETLGMSLGKQRKWWEWRQVAPCVECNELQS